MTTITYHPYPTEAGLFASKGVAEYRVATTQVTVSNGRTYTDVRVEALAADGRVITSASHSACLFATLRDLPTVSA